MLKLNMWRFDNLGCVFGEHIQHSKAILIQLGNEFFITTSKTWNTKNKNTVICSSLYITKKKGSGWFLYWAASTQLFKAWEHCLVLALNETGSEKPPILEITRFAADNSKLMRFPFLQK